MTTDRPDRCILIAGASGTVGQAAVRHFEALGGWQVIALSRRPAGHAGTGRVRQLSLDLDDGTACAAALPNLPLLLPLTLRPTRALPLPLTRRSLRSTTLCTST